jgi:spermidine/putrescine transport system substrate-binding protein
MDFVYDPEVAVDITAYVNYVCPVEGVQEILEKRDPALAKSQFIFPDEQTLQNAFVFRGLEPEEARELDDAFQRVIGA